MLTIVRAEIRLSALRHNFAIAQSLAGAARTLAVIKADAYGHGLLPAAHALAPQADGFAVARLHEALALREEGFQHRVLLLGSLLDTEALQLCAEHRIDVAVHDLNTCERILRHRGPALQVWLKLDSGMHRLGLNEEDFAAAHRQLNASHNVRELLHMTHFSCADTLDHPATTAQMQCVRQIRQRLDAIRTPLSQANSAALIGQPDSRGEWVRPGIMLYGDNPLAEHHALPLRAVMQLRARILALREVAAGQAVGYGGDWVARRPSRIATIGIGYGDGYPRHAPSGTPIAIGGRLAPLAGRVSMDAITVDVTDLPCPAIGDEVELWGDTVPVAEVARRAGTISYTLLTGINPRVPREYLDL